MQLSNRGERAIGWLGGVTVTLLLLTLLHSGVGGMPPMPVPTSAALSFGVACLVAAAVVARRLHRQWLGVIVAAPGVMLFSIGLAQSLRP
jgi:hypothetical protein